MITVFLFLSNNILLLVPDQCSDVASQTVPDQCSDVASQTVCSMETSVNGK